MDVLHVQNFVEMDFQMDLRKELIVEDQTVILVLPVLTAK
jgi:hypothetical protein